METLQFRFSRKLQLLISAKPWPSEDSGTSCPQGSDRTVVVDLKENCDNSSPGIRIEQDLLELTGLAVMIFHPLGRVFCRTLDLVYIVIFSGLRLVVN